MSNLKCFFRIRLLAAAAILLAAAGSAAADELPQWFRTAASRPVPAYEGDVPAVYLYSERQTALTDDGRIITTENVAIKLLDRSARETAVAAAFYYAPSGKVRDITAWIQRTDGTIKTYDKKSVIDRIANTEDVYNEGRLKLIDASDDVQVGDIFGYTTVSEEPPLFYQDSWSFQERLPVLVARYSLNLPQGWKANGTVFNAAPVAPSVNGTSYSWEMANLSPIPIEPMSPGVANLSPRIVVNFAPENPSQQVSRAFANWLDVSRWGTSINDPQLIVDDSIAAKARELTAGAKTELEKIRAVGSYAQGIQYISIDIGVGAGNGYIPRPSNLVLSRGYGDCKDKANLMRAMLKSLGIESFPIAIYSGDPTFVRAEWASPRQFNHQIVGVKITDATVSPAVMEFPKLGRLLTFDATDPYTPVGDLPSYLQGSNGLIMAGEDGGLAKMPVIAADFDRLERQIAVTLSPTGDITGTINERARGQASVTFRREFRDRSAAEYKSILERWINSGASGARLVDYSTSDKPGEHSFGLDTTFSAPRYGQLMQNRLLIFKPFVIGRRNWVVPTDPKRIAPVEIDSGSVDENVTFELPAGFAVDEMPPPVSLETDFGKYSTTISSEGSKLVLTRRLSLKRSVLPPEKYSAVRNFFAAIREAEQTPVVLVKK